MNLKLCEQTIGPEEISEIFSSLSSGFVTMGEKVKRFENAFAEYVGARHAIMVNSGSSANLVMLKGASSTEWNIRRLVRGDYVFVPALSWATTYWPVVQSGLTPVLVDCDPETLNIGPDQLAQADGLYPKAKGLVIAHIMGNPAYMDMINAYTENRGWIVLEDSCETLGSTRYGHKTGTWGLAGSFSFFYSHHMTTIEGGMVVTDDTRFAEICRMLRSHGWSRAIENEQWRKREEQMNPDIDPRFLFLSEGYNLRPTELNAAMGIHQLARLDEMNAKRKEIEGKMRAVVAPYPDLIQPIRHTPESDVALFAFPVLVNGGQRKSLGAFLDSHGIETRPIVAGNLAQHPGMGRPMRAGRLEGADRVARDGLYWGLHPNVTDEQIKHLGDVLTAYMEKMAA